ncbi:MAG: hypothetical protein JXB05_32815 [Myxococcaceae bacterium]|nr:hypothetical protein [Myxococcaceae bacterium]
MDPRYPPTGTPLEASRRTLRLTFKSSDDGVELVSVERLAMITPPQPGEKPESGKHGGHWFELRDDQGRALAHRLIDSSLLDSVEVHSPDGNIQREFGAMRSGVFEVLLPDLDAARTVVLVGNPLRRSRTDASRKEPSSNLASFELSPDRRGANR